MIFKICPQLLKLNERTGTCKEGVLLRTGKERRSWIRESLRKEDEIEISGSDIYFNQFHLLSNAQVINIL